MEYLRRLTERRKLLKHQQKRKAEGLVVSREDSTLSGEWAIANAVKFLRGKDRFVSVIVKTRIGMKIPINKHLLLPFIKSSREKEISQQQNEETDNMQENNDISPRRRTLESARVKILSMALALTFFMTLIGNTHGIYYITQLRTKQSLYFDPIANLQLIRDKWTLVVYYSMSPYWDGTTELDKLITNLDKSCSTTDSDVCSIILPQLHHEYKELQYYTQLMMQQFSFSSRPRQKPNSGYQGNLFRVLDVHLADQYKKDIEQIKRNPNYIAMLCKNQTTIVESESNLLKRTEEFIAKQHESIDRHLNKLDNLTNENQGLNDISQIQDQIVTSITASSFLQSLKDTQNSLLNTYNYIQHGQINTNILTTEQLQQELNLIAGQLPDDISLPIDQTDATKIYDLLKIKARMTDKYYMFELTFPLITKDRYKLYKIVSIPINFGKNMFTVTPESDLIAVDLKKYAYFPVILQDLTTCLTQDDTYTCELNKPIYNLYTDKDYCKNASNKCRVEESLCTDTWIRLNKQSEYLFHYCNNSIINITCSEFQKVEQLNNSGLIYLEPDCFINGQDFTIQSNRKLDNSIIVSPANASKIDQLNHIIIANFPLIENNTDEFNKQMKRSNNNDVYYDIILWIMVALAAASGGSLFWMWYKNRTRTVTVYPDRELMCITEDIENMENLRRMVDLQPNP